LKKKSVELKKETLRDLIRQALQSTYLPSSVYRLQMNGKFTYQQAQKVLPYLHDLGVDAVYSSPCFEATPGSPHGYDVTNPSRINPEIGTPKEFNDYCKSLKRNGMGQILDIVPNHMGIRGNHNLWWNDVLENGPSSFYSDFFDIDWNPEKKELKNKVLLPILGDQYGRVLENREIKVSYHNGQFFIHYWDHQLPVAPKSYPILLTDHLEDLRSKMNRTSRDYREYQAIIAAFRKLPARTEKNPATIKKRMIQKEDAKKRLAALTKRSKKIRSFVQFRLRLNNSQKGKPQSLDLLDQLLGAQAYRLSFWRVAAHEINYRRFFNINELAAIRMESDRVFQTHHAFLLNLLQEGKVNGVRIDHPDGLYDPPDYLRKLQKTYLKDAALKQLKKQIRNPLLEKGPKGMRRLDQWFDQILKEKEFNTPKALYVVVEKILDRKENLPTDWDVHGTVGYDFLNELNGLFIQRDHEKSFSDIYDKFIGRTLDFNQLIYDKKKLFAAFYMTSEVNTLGTLLDKISERDRRFRDFTLNDLVTAIREVIACFPVYRSYISPSTFEISERDKKYINIAIEKAKGKHPALSSTIFDFLRDILLLKLNNHEISKDEERQYRDFILRFQQLTAPIMAKGLEDTAFYINHRFISLNEVGGDPQHFGYSRGDFHRMNVNRSKNWPYGFLATSTHDTKRSEDLRMRLNVLSEIPDEWNSQIARWTRVNRKHKTLIGKSLEPGKNTEYLIYQTLVGVWPHEPFKNEAEQLQFAERVWTYLKKAVREAKIDTSWLNPNADYEGAVKKFIFGILNPKSENRFPELFTPFQRKISEFGMLNSLSALALKLGSPGVVDTYQGHELWAYQLVDPDNRQPVDYDMRKNNLAELQKFMSTGTSCQDRLSHLIRERSNGKIKQYILSQGLRFRKRFPHLFLDSDYLPLEIRGEREGNGVAFLRKRNGKYAIVAGGRFFTELSPDEAPWNRLGDRWRDTKILLPRELAGQYLRDIWTQNGVVVEQAGDETFVSVSSIFQQLPMAILTNEGK